MSNPTRSLPVHILYFSTVGPVRKQNQDNLFVTRCANPLSQSEVSGRVRLDTGSAQAVAIFDGMGGESHGEKASLLAADLLSSFTEKIGDLGDRKALRQAADSYYAEFLDALEEYLENDYTVCGTTCAGVTLQGTSLVPFWLGDSRVYLLRQGELFLLTRDHSLAQHQIDGGLLTEEEARKTSAWHTLTAYMGQYEASLALAESLELQPGDKLLLCSDGITDVIREPQLRDILKKSPLRALRELELIAKTRADDNCTAVLLCAGGDLAGRMAEQLERMREWIRS